MYAKARNYSFFRKKRAFNFRFTNIILYLHLLFSYSERENEEFVLQQRFQLPCTALLLHEHYELKKTCWLIFFKKQVFKKRTNEHKQTKSQKQVNLAKRFPSFNLMAIKILSSYLVFVIKALTNLSKYLFLQSCSSVEHGITIIPQKKHLP